jgi:hypothetical protein
VSISRCRRAAATATMPFGNGMITSQPVGDGRMGGGNLATRLRRRKSSFRLIVSPHRFAGALL